MTPTFSSSALGNSVSERNTEIKYIIEEEKRKAKGRKCERKQEGTRKNAKEIYIEKRPQKIHFRCRKIIKIE